MRFRTVLDVSFVDILRELAYYCRSEGWYGPQVGMILPALVWDSQNRAGLRKMTPPLLVSFDLQPVREAHIFPKVQPPISDLWT